MCRWISGLKRCEVAGFSNVKMSHSVVRKQNCMVLKQLVNLKYFEKIISNIQRFEGLEEGKITWCSNYEAGRAILALGLEEGKIT